MKLKNALIEIRQMAIEHPAFDKEAFLNRDYAVLEKSSRDIHNWTWVAILADDALRGKKD